MTSKGWALDNKDSPERYKIDCLTLTAGYSQLTNQPTHIVFLYRSYFHYQVKFVKDSGVEFSLFNRGRYNTNFGKVSLKSPLPLPYTREACNSE